MNEKVISLVLQDPVRQKALDCLFTLALPDAYIAAGFVRNRVWDYLHQKDIPTPLNDIDVIYFDPISVDTAADLQHEETLKNMMPSLNWQVRNQAHMHLRNGDAPYASSEDAMRYWPEKETAIGIRKVGDREYECIAPFGLTSLFSLSLTYNPKRDKRLFEQRVATKNWLQQWPKLQIAPH
ncbi:nucleotidyltransferase family protein [Enterovibrio norvegicus]|uniref:Nitrate reductase n=1 Tax=Enterovibrio norvegicus DSM 15893 TaxID=1121869 RepID=A0A1I5SP73_9GAMM|nr:nucleotidyltransferase family protein [Enterovibrio norvegicus]OEE64700.1 nitrate reductase [Enterovibrio norvegicus]OEF56246.1 nitrate reductase [Enterovibrio norvegicus]PMH60692.1 nitrate reductase [Enterovibrio norvegicus]TKF28691.1 nucleotidyltransferase family protein [Enterovibrio norvegicus]SFP72572.1 hypothetical protein SAMN03084138_02952 [Enterovibrio norvegicus DSM 15893]